MLEAMAGNDPNDPTTLPESAPAMLEAITNGVSGMRIGYDRRYASEDTLSSVAEAVAASVETLASLGAEIVDVELPEVRPYMADWPTLCSVEAYHAHLENYPSRADDYGNWFGAWLELGASVSAVEYAAACIRRDELRGLLARSFEGIDMLACPAQGGPAHRITEDLMYDDTPGNFDPARMQFTAPWDMNRAPSLTLPNGWSDEGLPLALQLVGPLGSEASPLPGRLRLRAGHRLHAPPGGVGRTQSRLHNMQQNPVGVGDRRPLFGEGMHPRNRLLRAATCSNQPTVRICAVRMANSMGLVTAPSLRIYAATICPW